MSKHTPGPWKAGEYSEHLGYDCMTGGIRCGPTVVLDAADYGQGRSWDGKEWDQERMEVDAHLIAAAPELLEACRQLVKAWDKREPWQVDAACTAGLAAIAKAERW